MNHAGPATPPPRRQPQSSSLGSLGLTTGPAMPHDRPRSFMAASLADLPETKVEGIRAPNEADKLALARLMYEAYKGTIDYEGEDVAQCLAEIEKTYSGVYGAFNLECSRLVSVAGTLASAALLTRWQERPFVAFSMTARSFSGRGFARARLLSAMRALHESGESEVRLVVTLANTPAFALYQSLGFRIEGGA